MHRASLIPDKTIFKKTELISHITSLEQTGDVNLERCQVFLDTINYIEDKSVYRNLVNHAENNLARWKQSTEESKESAACTLEVLSMDWGQAALELTRQYGVTFAILNMANADFPGGGVKHGAAAQEENLFLRTDCALYISNTDVQNDKFALRYTPEMTRLINGEDAQVYLDTENKRICFKGPEQQGYKLLSKNEIFSFYELRSAAQNCKDRSKPFDPQLARKKIKAQLDTLKTKGIRNAIFSAFGCGAFHNPPETIASIYKEELENFKGDFDHIAFAIYYPGYGPKTNFDVFHAILLGNKPGNTNNSAASSNNSTASLRYHELVTEFKNFHDMLMERNLIAKTKLLKIFETPSTAEKLKSHPLLQTQAIQLMESMGRFQDLFQKKNQTPALMNNIGLHSDIWVKSMSLVQEVISNCGIGGQINSPTPYRIEGLAALSKVLDKTTALLTVDAQIKSRYRIGYPEQLANDLENARLEMVDAVNAMRNTIEGSWIFRNERASRLTLGLLGTLALLSSITLTMIGILTFEVTAGGSAPFIYAGCSMFVPSLLLLGRSLTGGIQTKSWLQNWIGMGDYSDKTKNEAKHCQAFANTLFSFFPAPKPLELEPDSPDWTCPPCFGSRYSD